MFISTYRYYLVMQSLDCRTHTHTHTHTYTHTHTPNSVLDHSSTGCTPVSIAWCSVVAFNGTGFVWRFTPPSTGLTTFDIPSCLLRWQGVYSAGVDFDAPGSSLGRLPGGSAWLPDSRWETLHRVMVSALLGIFLPE